MGLSFLVALVRTLAAGLFLAVYILLPGSLFTLFALATGSVERLYRMGVSGAQIALRIAGVRVQAEGVEHIPPGVCLFVANHVSNLDPPVVVGRIPRRVALLAKQEVFRIPILGFALRLARFIPVDRADSAAARASAALAVQSLREGMSYLVFAEGTRSRDGRLGSFKRGSLALAIEARARVVPVSVIGTWKLLPRSAFVIRPGMARVVFHPPVDASAFSMEQRQALAEHVRGVIAASLPPEQQPCNAPGPG
jgi:1-acyl-sn-glycerol-3-phosphate acyltransferase